MRAIEYSAYGQTPRLVERPVPEPGPGGAVIRVEATGVCRSDWHAWQGHDPVPLPMVPGHELAGAISAIGPGVTRFRTGQRVTVPFVNGCGHCRQCRSGNAQVCPNQSQPGFTMPGSWAEYVRIDAADTNLVALPAGVDSVTAASLGCRTATAFRALHAHGRVAAGDRVGVFGCGGVGLAAVMIAVAAGARVAAVDVSPAALAAARALGATWTFLAADAGRSPSAGDAADGVPSDIAVPVGSEPGDFAERIAGAVVERTGGLDIGLDALGSTDTAAASLLSLGRRGRHLQVGLLLGEEAGLRVPMDRAVAWELEVIGSHGMAAADYPALLDAVVDGRLAVDRLVGRRIALEEAPAALARMGRPGTGAGMTVIDLSL